MKKLRHRTDYRERRLGGYQPAGDALDAIQKGFRSLMDQGFKLHPDTVAWVEACETVKERFQKR